MFYVKLNDDLKYQGYYTEKPILILKEFGYNDTSMYRSNIKFAGFYINLLSKNFYIDGECKDITRKNKLNRILK